MGTSKVKTSMFMKAIRDAWLMIGIVLFLFCLLEGGFSLFFFVEDRSRAATQPAVDSRAGADVNPDSTWVEDYYEEFRSAKVTQWRSYVYWRRRPFLGEHIHIDPDGIRLTTAATQQRRVSDPVKIFMFGGSAMWGTGARDAFTIPSLLSEELLSKGVAADVTNFGETGYVSTQEVIALLLQLRQGQLPDLVIFYDGANDTYSAYQQRVAGLPQNEFNRVKEFNLLHDSASGRRRDIVLRETAEGLSTIRFLRRFLPRAGIQRPATATHTVSLDTPSPPGEVLARDVLATYESNLEVVKALGEYYHFKCLFYWQPTVFQKEDLTAYEREQRAKKQRVEHFFNLTYEVMEQSRLREKTGGSFHDLSHVFAEVRDPVYIDWCHLGEIGNEVVAERMAHDVLAVVDSGS